MGEIRCPSCHKMLARRIDGDGVEVRRDGYSVFVHSGRVFCQCGKSVIVIRTAIGPSGQLLASCLSVVALPEGEDEAIAFCAIGRHSG